MLCVKFHRRCGHNIWWVNRNCRTFKMVVIPFVFWFNVTWVVSEEMRVQHMLNGRTPDNMRYKSSPSDWRCMLLKMRLFFMVVEEILCKRLYGQKILRLNDLVRLTVQNVMDSNRTTWNSVHNMCGLFPTNRWCSRYDGKKSLLRYRCVHFVYADV